MCVSIEMTVPIVGTFLWFISLTTGSWIIFFYTIMRSLAFEFLAMVALKELLVHPPTLIGPILLKAKPPEMTENLMEYTYFCFLFLIIAEAFLFVFCLHLFLGLTNSKDTYHLEYWLLCRLITWFTEVLTLFMLSLKQDKLLGYYLLMLATVILEIYLFVVVYSYYACLLIENNRKQIEEITNAPCIDVD